METKSRQNKVIHWDCTDSSTTLGPESIIISLVNALSSTRQELPCAAHLVTQPRHLQRALCHPKNKAEPRSHRARKSQGKKKTPQAWHGAIFFPCLISKENTPPLSSSPDMCFPSCAGLSLHCRLLHKESAAEQHWDPPCSGLSWHSLAGAPCTARAPAPSQSSPLSGLQLFWRFVFGAPLAWRFCAMGKFVFNDCITLLYYQSFLNLCNITLRKCFLPLTFQLGFQVPLYTFP